MSHLNTLKDVFKDTIRSTNANNGNARSILRKLSLSSRQTIKDMPNKDDVFFNRQASLFSPSSNDDFENTRTKRLYTS